MRMTTQGLRTSVLALSLSLTSLFAPQAQAAVDSLQLIPRPASVTYGSGTLRLPRTLRLSSGVPSLLRDGLRQQAFSITPIKGRTQAVITTHLDPTISGLEGYRLEVNKQGISLSARDEAGLRQGTQTLLQLTAQYGQALPYLSITDSARMPYRGVMLDVSRHFMKRDMILRLLDEMARYKLNRFHWHLVDGGGWRFPSSTKRRSFCHH